jgi:UMF1 family MFS transporter
MLGKFAAVIGPFLMGLVAVTTGNPRYSIMAIIILFVAGAGFLYLADDKGNVASSGFPYEMRR